MKYIWEVKCLTISVTVCATGIHIKRRVAVHPDIDPTNSVAFSESLPNRDCTNGQQLFQKSALSTFNHSLNWSAHSEI